MFVWLMFTEAAGEGAAEGFVPVSTETDGAIPASMEIIPRPAGVPESEATPGTGGRPGMTQERILKGMDKVFRCAI